MPERDDMSSTTRGEFALAIAFTFAIACVALPAQAPQIPADTEVLKHAAGFEYSILKKGTGTTKPVPGDAAAIHYSEWLSDGTLIRTSRNEIAIQVGLIGVRSIRAIVVAESCLSAG